jgi:hypothetical protein
MSNVPWQLQTKRRRRKGEGRPVIETLPLLDVHILAKRKMFPRNWHDRHEYDQYIAPGIARIILSRRQVDVHHSGRVQAIPIYWQRCFGLRPIFVCSCGRKAYRLRLIRGEFLCYRCCGLQYLSRSVSSAHRSVVQKKRLERFIQRWDKPMYCKRSSGTLTTTA